MIAKMESAGCGFGCVVCPGRGRCGEGGAEDGHLRTRGDGVAESAGDLLLAGTAVSVLVPGLSAGLARLLEPGAPPPGRRLATLARLRRAGVPAGLVLGPVLPGVNDRLGDLEEAAAEAARARALWFAVRPARAAGPARAGIAAFVERHRPHLAPRYRRLFGPDGEPPAAWEARLLAMAASVRSREGLAAGPDEAGAAAGADHQLRLPFVRGGIGYPAFSGIA